MTKSAGGEELRTSVPSDRELQKRRRQGFGHLKMAEERFPVQETECCSFPPVMSRRETREARRNMREEKRMKNYAHFLEISQKRQAVFLWKLALF